MDSKELRGLYEAYADVYAPQEEIDEASRADDTTRANIARYAGKKGISFEPGPNWDPSANRGRGAHLNPKQKEKQRRKALRQEELDIFDVVLEFLQAEGYAETLEEAEWMMANELDADDIDAILGEGKSSRPRYPGGRGVLDQERRDEKREASAENMRGHTAGPGTVTKNPKKLRKQKAMGEHG
jgi:hypothetical protein